MAKVDILALFPFLGGSIQSFIIKYDVGRGFFKATIYLIEEVLFYSSFVESFYHECVLDFVKCIFCISCDYCIVFVLYSIYMVYYII